MRDDYADLANINEIDVLIKRALLESTCEILATDGWKLLDSGLFHPHKRSFLKYYKSAFFKIDLHLEPVDQWIIYDDVDSYFAGAKPTDMSFYLPSDEVWLRHVICHIVLGKSEIANKYKNRIPSAIERMRITNGRKLIKPKNTPLASWKLTLWATANWHEIEKT